MESDTHANLFEQIGGKAAVDAAVDIFYEKVLADERISYFFRWIDMGAQRNKQKSFLAYAFGAPTNYTGKSMRKAHADLVDYGLTDVHFDAVITHLADTLKELQVAQPLIDQVVAITEKTREDVLGRNK